MEEFREFMGEGGFVDLDNTGLFYTWANNHLDRTFMEQRLDRAMVDLEFLGAWDRIAVHAGARVDSDHSPLFVSCMEPEVYQGGFPFRFQNMWIRHEGFLGSC